MFSLTDDELESLKRLAERLRAVRVEQEPQAEFAARMGVSRPTLSRMEQGDPAQAIGYWLRALRLLGRLEDFERLLEPPEEGSLFAQADKLDRPKPVRQRARRRPSK